MKSIAALALLAVSSQAIAGSGPAIAPVQVGKETVHFIRGVATLNLETETGAVQITPLAQDHGKLVFGVSAYNKGQQPANFGIENVAVTWNDNPVAIVSAAELEKRAKSRAMWSQIGVAMLAGAAAYAASQAQTTRTYNSRMYTPHGVYSWRSTYTDNSIGVLGATAATAGGVAGIVGIQNRLDYTLANIQDTVVQTTTVDPDSSYGGKVVIERLPSTAKLPINVRLVVNWNGADYPFTWQVAKAGTPPPPFTALTPADPPKPAVAEAPQEVKLGVAPVQPAIAAPPANPPAKLTPAVATSLKPIA